MHNLPFARFHWLEGLQEKSGQVEVKLDREMMNQHSQGQRGSSNSRSEKKPMNLGFNKIYPRFHLTHSTPNLPILPPSKPTIVQVLAFPFGFVSSIFHCSASFLPFVINALDLTQTLDFDRLPS